MLQSSARENALSICAADLGHPLLLAASRADVEGCFKLSQYPSTPPACSLETCHSARRNFSPPFARYSLGDRPEDAARSFTVRTRTRGRERAPDGRIYIRSVSMRGPPPRDPAGILPSRDVPLAREDPICRPHPDSCDTRGRHAPSGPPPSKQRGACRTVLGDGERQREGERERERSVLSRIPICSLPRTQGEFIVTRRARREAGRVGVP